MTFSFLHRTFVFKSKRLILYDTFPQEKMKLLLYIIALTGTLLVSGCTKECEYYDSDPVNRHLSTDNLRNYIPVADNKDILGVWINIVNPLDTLIIKTSKIIRWEKLSNHLCNYYNYTIYGDSILLQYTGLYKIGCPPFHRKTLLNDNKDVLIIQDFNKVFPCYPGDRFKKVE